MAVPGDIHRPPTGRIPWPPSFGEFVCDLDPELTSVAGLERGHIEAFLAWTASRASRGSHDHTKIVGPFVHAHAAIAVRGFLDDIWAWGWADAPGRRLIFDADIPRQPGASEMSGVR